jgi:RNA polymerase sigma factor (sigma-70 family)
MISRALTMLSDERLAQLAATGSDPAFSVLYSRYSGTLFAYCRSITRNAEDGWDALQNAMIKVLVSLRRTERTAPVRPWLFCIAHNEAVGILRRRSAAERLASAAQTTIVAGADEQAEIRERITEVVSDVQQLPTGQRAALVMRELADLRYDEIAVALETTEGNARQLVFAARAGLRDSRAGRGLLCESVRDQLSVADGRLLRRRSVRAHLRTCDGCRQYAVSVRRRAGQPARAALGAWSPLAGYDLLQSVFRGAADAGGAALVQGGTSVFGPLALKAAAVTAVVATGIGAADVATMKPEHSLSTAAVASAAQAAGAAPRRAATTAAGGSTSAKVTVVPAVATTASATTTTVAVALERTRRRSAKTDSKRTSRTSTSDPAAGTPQDDADPPLRRSGGTESRESRAPARARADCDGDGRSAARAEQPASDGGGSTEPQRDRDYQSGDTTTRDVAFTGYPDRRAQQGSTDAAGAPSVAGAQAGAGW